MKRNGNIVSYTAQELQDMRKRGESQTDWARVNAMTEEELEAAIASDPDEAGIVWDWSTATTEMPQPKAVLNMRIDHDILDYFKKQGRGYQTRINAVLRSYVDRIRS